MSEETLKLAREFCKGKIVCEIGEGVVIVAPLVAAFAEQIARECAEIADGHKRKDYDYRCSQEFRNGYECAAEHIWADIRAKFGIPEQERRK